MRVRLVYGCYVALMLLASSIAHAQLDFSISPTPVGSGARAAGMADAFSAVADDATAASWNPAGLVQLERPEISIVGEWIHVTDSFRDDTPVNNEHNHRITESSLNFLSYTHPLPGIVFGRNAVISITYQNKFDFNREFNVALDRSEDIVTDFLKYDFVQEGSLATISPAFAVELTHNFSVGLAVNLWRKSPFSDNGWEQRFRSESDFQVGTNPPESTLVLQSEKYDDFTGENFTAGLLWNVRPKWNLSLRYDSGFEGEVRFVQTTDQSNSFSGSIPTFRLAEKRRMRHPDTWGLGVSYRANDRLTLAAHVSRTDWNDFYIKQADGTRLSLIDGTDIDDPATKTDLDTTYSVRLGTEYVFVPRDLDSDLPYLWSLRGGLIYEEEPASGRSTFNINTPGSGEPDRFFGAAIGIGLQAFQRLNFDVAYQFRFGNNVKSDRVRGLDGFAEDYRQHRIIVSSIIYF